MNDMMDLCLRKSPIGLSEMDIKFCFGMSKMTVVVENASIKEYNRLQFVEFLEFIGRIAQIKFKQSGGDSASLSLATKIEYILDDLFAGYGM